MSMRWRTSTLEVIHVSFSPEPPVYVAIRPLLSLALSPAVI
jgi:hypothetical protein